MGRPKKERVLPTLGTGRLMPMEFQEILDYRGIGVRSVANQLGLQQGTLTSILKGNSIAPSAVAEKIRAMVTAPAEPALVKEAPAPEAPPAPEEEGRVPPEPERPPMEHAPTPIGPTELAKRAQNAVRERLARLRATVEGTTPTPAPTQPAVAPPATPPALTPTQQTEKLIECLNKAQLPPRKGSPITTQTKITGPSGELLCTVTIVVELP